MKVWQGALLLSCGAVSCGSKEAQDISIDEGGASPSGLYVTKYAKLIGFYCGGCHTGSPLPSFSTLSQVQVYQTAMLTTLSTAQMPPDNPSFSSTPDGQALMAWLAQSPLSLHGAWRVSGR